MKRTLVRLVGVLLACVPGLVLTGLLPAQQSARDLFSEAERRFESGDFEFALNRYQVLIQEHPVSQYIPDAQFRIAVALYRTGDSEGALAQLDRVARRYRSTRYIGYVPFWKGIVQYDLEEYADAIASLTLFLDSELEDAAAEDDALLHVALAHLALENEPAARAALTRLLADEPHLHNAPYPLTLLLSLYAKAELSDEILVISERLDVESLAPEWQPQIVLYQAEAYRINGEIDRAAELYRSVEDSRADVATVAFQRLFQLAEAGEIDDAPEDVLRRAEQVLAGQTDVLKEFWLRVGIDSYNKGKYDLAELYFRRIWDLRAVETIPATVPLYLSRLLGDRGDAAAAESILDEYLRLGSPDEESRTKGLIALGNLQLRQGDAESAVASLEPALELVTDDALYSQAAYQYAFALRETGATDQALEVVDAAFAAGRTGSSQAELQRLRSRLLHDMERYADAVQSLYEYLALRPNDGSAAAEYVKLLYQLERYERIATEAGTLVDRLRSMANPDPIHLVQILYVLGLSDITLKEYEAASERLEDAIALFPVGDDEVDQLLPYAHYYAGWAFYRSGEYRDARTQFGMLVSIAPQHTMAARALFLSGWSSFRLGDYDAAATSLASVGTYDTDDELRIEATFLLGRTLVAQSALQQAAATFRGLYLENPDSSYADDARYEHGQVLAALGNVDGAVTAFTQLIQNHPDSPLAEAASFRRGEVYFNAGRYSDAQAAFFAYRTEYRSGTREDEALYWGGIASDELGETAGALLLWERLIADHRDSPFRPDAMQRSAVAHQERDEYRQALNLYTELQSAYPETASAIGAQRRIDRLVLLLNGLTDREAELYVAIERNNGAESEDGRQAIIELARLAIYEDTATGIDTGTVIPLLETVAEQTADAVSASQALFLLGEYSYRRNEYLKAADLYLQAAEVGAVDRDLIALSLYRAAAMYSTVGRTAEVRALVEELEEQFPQSEWLEEAQSLVREAD
jgi:TolA-binding protein